MHDIDRTQMEFESFEAFESFNESGVFNENEEMELAAELLAVSSEDELDHFLGSLLSKAGQAAGRFISSPQGQALGGLLKGAAKKLLPMAGQAVGGYFGGSTGAQIGGNLASSAGSMLGLETESEDREFEAASNFVRLAGEAVKNLGSAPQGGNPKSAAAAALTEAAKIHAPGLIAPGSGNGTRTGAVNPATSAGTATQRAQSGRWIRRGSKIVLFGV